MSEPGRSAHVTREAKAKGKDKEYKGYRDYQGYQSYQDNQTSSQEGPDPFCCTPPGGGGGADTKP